MFVASFAVLDDSVFMLMMYIDFCFLYKMMLTYVLYYTELYFVGKEI